MIDQTNRAPAHDSVPDPDLELLIDYVLFELDADQVVAVQQRMASDHAFHRRMEMILYAMSATAPTTVTRRSRSIVRFPARIDTALASRFARVAALYLVVAGLAGGAWSVVHRTKPISDAVNAEQLARVGIANDTTGMRVVTLPGTSTVTLEQGSRVRSAAVPGSTQESLELLDGEATVNVRDKSGEVMIVTAAGQAALTPGRYHIRMEDSSTMWVKVERGTALVRGRAPAAGEEDGIVLKTGQEVRVRR
jgi:ferric-dicitrate binding protein FerR (iron transport regulator)